MSRPFEKHIDSRELDALVSTAAGRRQQAGGLSLQEIHEAEHHADLCVVCSGRVAEYRRMVERRSGFRMSELAYPGKDCPRDIDWHEVAAGLWPELKTRQLLMHAAVCGHCGPLLRSASNVDDDPTLEEEALLAELRVPARPEVPSRNGLNLHCAEPSLARRKLLRWKVLVPAFSLLLVFGIFRATQPTRHALSGQEFIKMAAQTHRQYAEGKLALEVRSDSQQVINNWFQAKAHFPVSLPASPPAAGEQRPVHLEGARMVSVGRSSGGYIAYKMNTRPVSLLVVPEAVAVASGGTRVDFTKVSFHYDMFQGYKVVTWSVHGLTYALVSEEGTHTQQSCMVCHSAMHDRDLSNIPTPLYSSERSLESHWQ